MAFNWQTFRTRALSAAVFVILMLIGLLLNRWSFLILFSIIHFGCWWEYLSLVEKITASKFHSYIKLGLMCIGYGLMLWFTGLDFKFGDYILSGSLTLPFSAAGFVLVVLGIFQKQSLTTKSYMAAVAGLAYISISFGCMISLYDTISTFAGTLRLNFPAWVLPAVITASIWINDTMAYIMGSLFGRTPLSKISPRKTWEGTIAGVVLAIAAVGLFFVLVNPKGLDIFPYWFWFVVAGITAIAGTLGDLLESKLKRMAGVKDSGNLMPGHGGFLDRYDSLLLATPFVYAFVTIFLAMMIHQA